MRLESGVAETTKEKFDRIARERIGNGKSTWWVE